MISVVISMNGQIHCEKCFAELESCFIENRSEKYDKKDKGLLVMLDCLTIVSHWIQWEFQLCSLYMQWYLIIVYTMDVQYIHNQNDTFGPAIHKNLEEIHFTSKYWKHCFNKYLCEKVFGCGKSVKMN